jgi:hypothetical protein
MKGFNLDLHVSVIADVIDILNRVDPTIKITSWNMSGHSWVMKKTPAPVEIITPLEWRDLTKERIEEFHAKYDHFLSTFDFFVAGHPNEFAMIYEKYGKPIILVNTCRYDMPYCWTQNMNMLSEWNECLVRLQQKNLLTIFSNNKADATYMQLALRDLKPELVPSLCLYTGMNWKPENQSKFLVYTGSIIHDHPLVVNRQQIGDFEWSHLMTYRGIIHFPYEISTMSIFEQISSGIPLFFPSKNCLHNMPLQSMYWHHKSSSHPAHFDSLNQSFWVENADFYDFKFVYYFDNVRHLMKQLESFSETPDILEKRRKWLAERKIAILDEWGNCFKKLRRNNSNDDSE